VTPELALVVQLAQLVAMHLGKLHPYEKVLTLVLAFGPFVVLGLVIAVRRRHDSDADDSDDPR
jgi:Na+-translocating ferredoxin:NAD+ oxidoreductase RnfE subunit